MFAQRNPSHDDFCRTASCSSRVLGFCHTLSTLGCLPTKSILSIILLQSHLLTDIKCSPCDSRRNLSALTCSYSQSKRQPKTERTWLPGCCHHFTRTGAHTRCVAPTGVWHPSAKGCAAPTWKGGVRRGSPECRTHLRIFIFKQTHPVGVPDNFF